MLLFLKPMKTFLVLLLLFSIKTNAQLLPSQSTSTTPSTTPTPATSTPPTLTTSSSSSTPTSTTASHTSSISSASTTSSSTTSTSADTSTTSSPVTTTPVVTSIDGTATTIVTVVGPSSSTSSSQPAPSSAPPSPSDTSGGLSTGSIIGLSVAGGVAVIGLIAFFIWKLTRKRFSDFDNGEAIKWPDLTTPGGAITDTHPLPVHNTGGAGFDTGSQITLSRVDSNKYSTADLHSNDPYAVPPLPHLNPNQPYRDDPAGAYYDPYIPGTIERDAGREWSRNSFAMTEMNRSDGSRSPGPQAAYGRTAPQALQAPYSGRISPEAYGASTTIPPAY